MTPAITPTADPMTAKMSEGALNFSTSLLRLVATKAKEVLSAAKATPPPARMPPMPEAWAAVGCTDAFFLGSDALFSRDS